MRLTRSQKKLAVLAFVSGSLTAAGFLASSAHAGPCTGATAATSCDDSKRSVDKAVASAMEPADVKIHEATTAVDGTWARARAIAKANGLPDPGAVSVPTVSGPLPPIGPVGPGPVGDGLRKAGHTVDAGFDAYQRAVGQLPNGGEVSVPTVSGPLPPIGPVGPGPVGDGLHKAVKPVFQEPGADSTVKLQR